MRHRNVGKQLSRRTSHQADLVAQIKLKAMRYARNEADHVESHHLQIQQVAAEQSAVGKAVQRMLD